MVRKRLKSRKLGILAHFHYPYQKLEMIPHRKNFTGGAKIMKTPWRYQVEQTPHREIYNGGGVVFKGRLYNQVVWKFTNFGEVQFPRFIVAILAKSISMGLTSRKIRSAATFKLDS